MIELQLSNLPELPQRASIIERAMGPQALALLGTPTSDRQELCQAIERNRQAVSQRLGRCMAQQYGFDYPAALEETVLRGWEVFLVGRGEDHEV